MPDAAGSMFDARPDEVRAAGKAMLDAAGRAHGIELHGPLNALAAALPGGSAAPAASGCRIAGRQGVVGWAERTQRHGENLSGAGDGYQRVEADAGRKFVLGQLDSDGAR